MYIIPGLWDMHVHYWRNYRYSSPLLIANGITGVREMFGNLDTINKIRREIKNQTITAPDIYTSGPIIDGKETPFYDASRVSDEGEAIVEVQKQLDMGVDFIKVYTFLSREAFFAIAELCNNLGIPYAGHVPLTVSLWEAIDHSMKSIEHQLGFIEACVNEPIKRDSSITSKDFMKLKDKYLLDNFNLQLYDSLSNILSESGTYLCPTFTALKSDANLDNPDLLDDPRLEFMHPWNKWSWSNIIDSTYKYWDKDYYETKRNLYNINLSLVGNMEDKGVKILAGTDFPNPYCFPGFSLHEELELMVEGGMSNLGALKAATINPAAFMRIEDEFGRIEPSYVASLVILRKNPLENIRNTQEIESVFLRGVYYSRTELDSLVTYIKDLVSSVRLEQ